MTKQIGTALVVGILIIIAGLYLVLTPSSVKAPTTTDDLPRADESQQGQPTYTNATPNDIVVTLPFPGAVVGKEFSVRGKARGYWFFEASFPVALVDKDGKELAIGLASPEPADTEWMTTEFINFKADLVVNNPNYIGPATLLLKKDNPSGEPARDSSVSFPINVEY